jgi:hypothetical protein
MSASPLSARLRRSAVVGLSATLAAAGLAATAPTSGAVSPSIDYACSSVELGDFTLPVVLDTTAPPRMIVGQSTTLLMTAKATLPGEQVQAARTPEATKFAVKWDVAMSLGTVSATGPQTELGSEVPATARSFTATSVPFAYKAPAAPGTVEITAAGITGSMQRYDVNGAQVGSAVAITCPAPNGKAPVVDTIAVAASTTTTLTLSKATSAYGEDVTATAKVTASSGTPAGEVAFAVDGIVTRVKVGRDGVTTLVLPDAKVGTHTVIATFAPTDATTFVVSTAPAQSWTVAQAATSIRVPVTGRTTTKVTRVGVEGCRRLRHRADGQGPDQGEADRQAGQVGQDPHARCRRQCQGRFRGAREGSLQGRRDLPRGHQPQLRPAVQGVPGHTRLTVTVSL